MTNPVGVELRCVVKCAFTNSDSVIFKRENEDQKKFELKKKVKNKFSSVCPTFVFEHKLYIILISQINILHKLYSHVRYEMTYHHKKFQNFSIKTLTIMACPNFKKWLWAFRE